MFISLLQKAERIPCSFPNKGVSNKNIEPMHPFMIHIFISKKWLLLALMVSALLVLPGWAMNAPEAPSVRFLVLPDSQVSIDGSSNLTDWGCTNFKVIGQMELLVPRSFIREIYDRLMTEELSKENEDLELPADWIKYGKLSLRIHDLDCGSRGIEKDLQHALKAKEHPDIVFILKDIKAGGPIGPERKKGLRLHCTGQLAMAGANKDLNVDLAVKRTDADHYEVQASMKIKMTDFIEAPPKALLGLIKVSNDVQVDFNLVMTDSPELGSDSE